MKKIGKVKESKDDEPKKGAHKILKVSKKGNETTITSDGPNEAKKASNSTSPSNDTTPVD